MPTSTARSLLQAAVAIALCASLAPPASAAAIIGPARSSVAQASSEVPNAAPSATSAVADELTPLVADFDGDRRSDVFWYGPGSLPDHLWLGRADRNFVGVPKSVSGTYQPVVGDFNGDGPRDVLWYGPGASKDVLWLGRPGGVFSSREITVNGTYQPFVGDFNGDHRHDVFWYGPGAARDVVWYGRADGTFAPRYPTVNGTYQPLVGDFNGDGPRDILWYGAGAAHDVLWLGRRGTGFSSRTVVVSGKAQPLLGDFNGDHRSDVFWYAPGTAQDVVWYGRGDGRFASRYPSVNGTYQPLLGDFNGDGPRDIFWYGAGSAKDVIWFGHTSATFSGASVTVSGTYQPHLGDFGGDGLSDIFWYAPGAPDDFLWFGRTSGAFSMRATTLDLGYTRARPLRPDELQGDEYNPFGFVAHAMGSVDRYTRTNTLEAFEQSYARGFRVFECDQVLLKDGTVLIAHDGSERYYGLNKSFRDATWADLAGHKYQGMYTILRSQDVVQLAKDHPDVYFILDIKYSSLQVYRTFIRQATTRSLRERLLPHVRDQADLNSLRTVYPLQNYVLALYRTQFHNTFDDPAVVSFVKRNRTPAVMMFWRTRDYSLTLAQNASASRRYRSAFATALKSAGATVFTHSLVDPTEIQRFWNVNVGVYSDDPFPPLGTEPATLIAPTFSESVPEE